MKNWFFYSTALGTLRLRRNMVDELTAAQALAKFDGSSVTFTEPVENLQVFFAKAKRTRRSQTAAWVTKFNERVQAESGDRQGA
jgi:hypothetical protein